MYDYIDDHGILVHKYGPHAFHTSNIKIINYVRRYAEWQDFHLICGAQIDGIYTPTPFNFKTIDDFYAPEEAAELKRRITVVFSGRSSAAVVEVLECADPMVRSYAEFLFEKDYSLYTAKQWGISPNDIDPSILKRVPLRFSYDEGYFDDEFQVMPKVSFTHFFKNLLDHPNISVELGVDALNHLQVNAEGNQLLLGGIPVEFPVIYTGALDELFGIKEGPLPYRSLHFEWKYKEKGSIQPYPVVAYPQAEGYTRIVDFKHFSGQDIEGSSYEVEYPLSYDPFGDTEPYYPVLTQNSQEQYKRYAAMANQLKHLHICGRLADFKYYNMDQALERALNISEVILSTY